MVAVQSVKRAFLILDVVARHPHGIGLTDLAFRVNLPKSTVSRLLATLEDLSAVERTDPAPGFKIGPRLHDLIGDLPFPRQLEQLAKPALTQLVAETTESAALCVLIGREIKYLLQVQSQYHLQVKDWTGERFPAHSLAAGKILLAELRDGELETYLSEPLLPLTEKTVTTQAALERQLAAGRADGYFWVDDEVELGISGTAAPVFDNSGRAVAALNVFGPTSRLAGAQKRLAIAATVSAAAELSLQLKLN